jgi:hypothetical protein
MQNSGVIRANGGFGAFIFNDGPNPNQGAGGNGGLVVFSGPNNPSSTGTVVTYGGFEGGAGGTRGRLGSIVAPDPATSTNTLIGVWRKTQPVELLTHAENLILLTKNGGNAPVSANVFDRLLQATIRSVGDPAGASGQARAEVISKNTGTSAYVFRNLILSSSRDNLALNMTHTWNSFGGPGELIFPSPLSMGEGFSTLNTLTIANDGLISTQELFGGTGDASYQPTNFWLIGRNSNSLGGGRISLLANGNINNLNIFGTTGMASGGSVNIATQGSFVNSANLTTTGSALHGGSIMVKAGNDIVWDNALYYAIPLMSSNGGLLGGTIRLLPMRDFSYPAAVYVTSINANGSLHGGVININAGRDSFITNVEFGSMITRPTLTANCTSSISGRGGFIHINAGNTNSHDDARIEANGGLEAGTVLFTTGN